MLVNENRLSLADARARKWLAEPMEKHFVGGGAQVPSGYVPPTKSRPDAGSARSSAQPRRGREPTRRRSARARLLFVPHQLARVGEG
jgi:hypothetical protein